MNKNQRTFVLMLSVGIILIFGYVIFSQPEENVKPKTEQKQSIYVKTVKVKPSTNNIVFKGHGRVSSSRRINLAPEVQGKLLSGSVTLKQGTRFKAGDLLFRVKNTEAALALQAKKSSFLNRVASILPDIQIDFESQFNQWQAFFNAIEVDKTLPALPLVKDKQLKTYLATKNVLTDYYGILVDEERLSKYNIYAPFSGTVVSVNAEIGTSVNPGTSVATILNTSNLEIEIPINKDNAKMIAIGNPVTLFDENNQQIEGMVSRISNNVNANTQSMSVFAITRDKKLADGMYLSAEIIADNIKNTVKVPVTSIQKNSQILTVTKGKIAPAKASIAYQAKEYVLLKGFSSAVEIVAEPLSDYNQGTTVKTIPAL